MLRGAGTELRPIRRDSAPLGSDTPACRHVPRRRARFHSGEKPVYGSNLRSKSPLRSDSIPIAVPPSGFVQVDCVRNARQARASLNQPVHLQALRTQSFTLCETENALCECEALDYRPGSMDYFIKDMAFVSMRAMMSTNHFRTICRGDAVIAHRRAWPPAPLSSSVVPEPPS